jgi:hypothetical protein
MIRFLPTQPREVARIDSSLRLVLRKASTDGIRWPLVIIGKPGTGKTCAGLSVCDYVRGAEWWPWEEFWRFTGDVNLGRAKGIFLPGKDTGEGWRESSQRVDWTPKKFWQWFGRLPLAVLDDVGLRGSANDMQYEAFKLALDSRSNVPTIVTSNLAIEGLGRVFDARIMDRLSAGTVVELNGLSMR